MSDYHVHVYFDAETKNAAFELRDVIGEKFPVAMGRFHEKPVGPHPRWSFQVAFDRDVFADLVGWLMLNRKGLTIFMHPNTGDALGDHAERAVWMGEMLPLELSVLTSSG